MYITLVIEGKLISKKLPEGRKNYFELTRGVGVADDKIIVNV